MNDPTDAAGAAARRARHHDVAAVLVQYATAIDRRDWPRLRRCFTEDCDADYGDIGRWRSAAELTDWMAATHEPCGPTLHRITNIVVDAGADEPVDAVESRCYVDALVLLPDGAGGAHVAGCYDDALVRTPDGWRIARRRFTAVLMEAVGDGVGF